MKCGAKMDDFIYKECVPCKVHVHAPMVVVGLLADAGPGDATEEVLCCLALLEVVDSATCPWIPLLVTVSAGPFTPRLTGALDSSENLLTALPARSGVPAAGLPGIASIASSLSACCSSFPGMSCSRSSAASNTVHKSMDWY